MKTIYSDTYQLSPRVTLTPGDKFRVSGGPYYRMPDGSKIKIAVRGVCTFIRAQHRGAVTLIEARDREGFTVLHVAGRRRSKAGPALVCRPYTIKSRVKPTETPDAQRRTSKNRLRPANRRPRAS